MKFKTAKVLSGTLNSDLGKTASVIFMPPAPKNLFGHTIVRGRAGFEEAYIIITKDFIIKSTKSPSVLNLI